jgi:hypothetical protein
VGFSPAVPNTAAVRDATSRRTVLAVAAGWLGSLAGCGGSPGAPDGTTATTAVADETGSPAGTTAETATAGGDRAGTTQRETTATTAGGDLDLREANVVGVAAERRDGAYRFDVTLLHDDDGEDGYANWWQVESRDGERLGRRELLHAHGTREFTRSATVEVPDGVTEVVVRGHDQTHGYGGQAMLVKLETGATTAVRQGSEPRSFAES